MPSLSTTSADNLPDARSYLQNKLEVPTKSQLSHDEYGICNNDDFRFISSHNTNEDSTIAEVEDPSYYILISTYVSFVLLIVIGHMRDFFGKRMFNKHYKHLMPNNGYAALLSDFDSFYTRRLKLRIDDCFSRPTTGVPGRTILTLDRDSDDYNNTYFYSGSNTRCLNVSSYNYLGFAQARGGCADAVEDCISRYGISAGGPRLEGGTLDLHHHAEKLVAKFLGTQDAMLISMGFATNSTTIPALVNKGCLVISDELNHSSIRFGVRLSGASVRQYKHNDMKDLENLLRETISQGQPRTHRPWKKILLIVEGLYSMEGTLVNLPAIMEMKNKYKFYLYIDEAHSIGAIGPHGRGVCDYFGINPRLIDILMGTVTKSFGAAGGYIAGDQDLVNRIRQRSHGMTYAESMSPPVLTQIISSLASITGVKEFVEGGEHISEDTHPGPVTHNTLPHWMTLPRDLLDGTEGKDRLRRLAFNARYLSSALRKMGFIMSGSRDSPIVPLFIFNPAKLPLFSRTMMDRLTPGAASIVVVVVAYPATPLTSGRVRFCLSSSHTKGDIDELLRACDEVGDLLSLKLSRREPKWTVDECIDRAVELVQSEYA
ncbi:Serine palmitoyltransferase 2 [Wallemia ichthyophaga EXF-994]|uniref:serine C-palmitoyltransferase n=1 Tax=Wallemia ichthyophaga (strain EXF-994 / CBS 113033) TaxID=1299270 RepID=R9ANK1_WALI9|nr:Serine palmitoyltransferase 2 [Wallemia ichthyophaga EXF-994]EOR03779.1 Serine palmitoyltransferase 2 [Wallemia ichthyophaga EXF-994]